MNINRDLDTAEDRISELTSGYRKAYTLKCKIKKKSRRKRK